MKPEYKKYILDNVQKRSVQQIAEDLNLKERTIRWFLEEKGINPVSSSPLHVSPFVRNGIIVLSALVITSIFISAFISIRNHVLVADEIVFNLIINKALEYNLDLLRFFKEYNNMLASMFPTYFLTIAFVAKTLHVTSYPSFRLISFVLNMIVSIGFILAAIKVEHENGNKRIWQFFLFPLIFPFYFLIYTDVSSLGFVILSAALTLRRRFFWSAFFGAIAVLFRQNNVIWIMLFYLILYGEENGLKISISSILRHVIKGWMYLLIVISFIIFVYLNKGIAMGLKEMHPGASLYVGNVYFALFTFFFAFLPIHIYNFSSVVRLIKKIKGLLPLFALFLIYWFFFKNNHPWNGPDRVYYFRNKILCYFINGSIIKKFLFFLPMAYSFLSLIVTPLEKKVYCLLYPFTLIFLITLWLIESRYYIVPFVLFLLFRKRQHIALEYSLILYFAALSFLVYQKINYTPFFL